MRDVNKRRRPSATPFGLLLGLLAACSLLLGGTLGAEEPKGQPKASPKSVPDAPGKAPLPPAKDEKAGVTKSPESPQQRAKLLNDLYSHLAAAPDAATAAPIAEAIERLWHYSGSDTITLLMDRSLQAIVAKNLDLALKLLDSVVEMAPDFAEGWNVRARVHHHKNDYERALGDLRRALALDANHYRALDGLAQILREIGQKKASLKAYKELLQVHPNWPGAQQTVEELSRDVDGQGI